MKMTTPKRFLQVLFLCNLALVFGAGCNNRQASIVGGDNDVPEFPSVPVVTQATCELSFSPSSVTAEANTLGVLTNPAAVKLRVGIEDGPARVSVVNEESGLPYELETALPTSSRSNHTLDVTLGKIGTYEFEVELAGSNETCSGSVEVSLPPVTITPKVEFFTENLVSVDEVPFRGDLTIAWIGTDVSTCSFTKNGLPLTNLSSEPTGTFSTGELTAGSYIYQATCTGSYGNASATVGISASPAPTAALTLNWANKPSPLAIGGQVDLVWSSTDADACVLFNGSNAIGGERAAQGTFTVTNLQSTSTFKVKCRDSKPNFAEVSQSVPVADPLPVLNISASPLSIVYNGSTTVTWSTTNASGCSVYRGGVDTAKGSGNSGSFTDSNLVQNTVYTLNCSGGVSRTVSVSVAGPTDHWAFRTVDAYHGNMVGSNFYAGENAAVAHLSGVDRADAICTFQARAVGKRADRPWKAILSTTSISARDRIALVGPVYGTAGQLVSQPGGLWAGSIAQVIPLINGAFAPSVDVWTGSNAGGNRSGDTCNNWTSADDDDEGRVGDTGDLDDEWIGDDEEDCDDRYHLYCISQ